MGNKYLLSFLHNDVLFLEHLAKFVKIDLEN